jgi:hypothetical protein
MLLSRIGAAVAVGMAVVIGASPALAATGWTIVPAPPTGQNAGFTAVTTTSDSNAWAVGSENAELKRSRRQGPHRPLERHRLVAGGHTDHPGEHGQPGRGQREQF